MGAGLTQKGLLTGVLWLVAALVLNGCGGQKAASCPPKEGGVGVCLEGKPVSWSVGARPPHEHEPAGYYAPVQDLERALGVQAMVSSDRKHVAVNGKQVLAFGPDAMGIHAHDGYLFTPIKEFAEAAGFKVSVDPSKHTVSISRP